jgi:hypothetical protein
VIDVGDDGNISQMFVFHIRFPDAETAFFSNPETDFKNNHRGCKYKKIECACRRRRLFPPENLLLLPWMNVIRAHPGRGDGRQFDTTGSTQMQRKNFFALAVILLISVPAADAPAQTNAGSGSRFFHSGDGHIHLFGKKNGRSFVGLYRTGPRDYDGQAFEAMCQVFDAPCESPDTAVSLRLIEFLDLLQDRLAPGSRITITSGYRSPQYNRKIASGGALAAKASLHQYGMAADVIMEGVTARQLWDYVKSTGFGGAGYYHGETVHIDVGPARSWDETTSGVGTGISDDNKLIGLVTDFDRYRPQDTVTMQFIRMTAFPIDVAAEFALDRFDEANATGEVDRFAPTTEVPGSGNCRRFGNIAQMASIRWQLPADLPAGNYRVRARFCESPWDQMPAEIATPVFTVERKPDS